VATVWFDAAAAPQAVWFAGLRPSLLEAGHDVVVTCRTSAATADVTRLVLGEPAAVVDGHAPGSWAAKAGAIASRAWALSRWYRQELARRPDVHVVSHNSYAQLLAARRLGLPALTAMDYEGQPANHVAFRAATRVLLPAAFPVDVARRQGASDRKRVTYPGLKEAMALTAAGMGGDGPADAPGLAPWTGLDLPLAVFRPEAGHAAYLNGRDHGLGPAVVARLRALGCHVLVVPRDPVQADEARRRWVTDDHVDVLDRPVLGPALLQRADVVVGAGGTMTREAALLGTPTFSVFRGRVPAVDLALERAGRLVRVRGIEDLARITLGTRRPPAVEEMEATRAAVVEAVLRFLEPTPPTRPVFVAWMDADARAAGLAARVNADLLLHSRAGARSRRYLAGSARTLRAARQSSVAVVTNPPVLAPLAAVAGGGNVVVDHHAGAFNDPRWRWALPVLRAVEPRLRAHMVHTEEHAAEARRRFRRPVLVIQGAPVAPHWARELAPGSGSADVVLVAGHAFDEPLADFLTAAASLPQVRFLVTGTPRQPLAPPSNVAVPGHLPADEYWRTLAGARLVVSLTTRDATMQQGGYDALDLGRPLVTSDTAALRAFFADAAVYVRPDAASIAEGVEKALADEDRLAAAAETRRSWWEARVEQQLLALAPLLA
jgi:hypothetical protein